MLYLSNESWAGKTDGSEKAEENTPTVNCLQKIIPLNILILGLYSIFDPEQLISKYSIRASKYGFVPKSKKNDETRVTCFNCGENLNLECSEDADKLNTYSENCHKRLPNGQICVYAAMNEPCADNIFLSRDQIKIWYRTSIEFGQFKGINFTIEMVDYDTEMKFINDKYFTEINETRKRYSPIGSTRNTSISENISTVASASGFTDTSIGFNANSSTAHQIENSVTRSSYEPTFGNCGDDKTQLMSLSFSNSDRQKHQGQHNNYHEIYPTIYKALKGLSYSDESIFTAIQMKLSSGNCLQDEINSYNIEMFMDLIKKYDTNESLQTVSFSQMQETQRQSRAQAEKYAKAYARLINENICTNTELIYRAIYALERSDNTISDSNNDLF